MLVSGAGKRRGKKRLLMSRKTGRNAGVMRCVPFRLRTPHSDKPVQRKEAKGDETGNVGSPTF